MISFFDAENAMKMSLVFFIQVSGEFCFSKSKTNGNIIIVLTMFAGFLHTKHPLK